MKQTKNFFETVMADYREDGFTVRDILLGGGLLMAGVAAVIVVGNLLSNLIA